MFKQKGLFLGMDFLRSGENALALFPKSAFEVALYPSAITYDIDLEISLVFELEGTWFEIYDAQIAHFNDLDYYDLFDLGLPRYTCRVCGGDNVAGDGGRCYNCDGGIDTDQMYQELIDHWIEVFNYDPREYNPEIWKLYLKPV